MPTAASRSRAPSLRQAPVGAISHTVVWSYPKATSALRPGPWPRSAAMRSRVPSRSRSSCQRRMASTSAAADPGRGGAEQPEAGRGPGSRPGRPGYDTDPCCRPSRGAVVAAHVRQATDDDDADEPLARHEARARLPESRDEPVRERRANGYEPVLEVIDRLLRDPRHQVQLLLSQAD